MTVAPTYRARLRFRLHKKLAIHDSEHRLMVANREVVLSPPTPQERISDSEWLIMNARGFDSEEAARDFGSHLKTALEISAVAVRLGVDTGVDAPTSALGAAFREETLKQTGIDARPNVHGLDVFLDEPHVRIFNMNATATVHAAPDPFLNDLDTLHTSVARLSPSAADVVLLLNYALMQPEPVAQIVFAVSAVESLGQDQTWTDDQRALLRELAQTAMQSAIGAAAERLEIADALRKSLHRLTLRQGVFRLLDRLNLVHLKTEWDQLYAERSALVHGIAPQAGADYGPLAHRTVSLCGKILLTAVAAEVPTAARHVDRLYGS